MPAEHPAEPRRCNRCAEPIPADRPASAYCSVDCALAAPVPRTDQVRLGAGGTMMPVEGRTMNPTYRDVLMTYTERDSPYWPFSSWVVDPDDGYDLDAPSELSQVLARYQAWGWKLVSPPPTGNEAVYRATFRLDLPETSVFLPLLDLDEPAGIPDAWRIGTAPGFVQRRECYRRAWRYIEQHPATPGPQAGPWEHLLPGEERPYRSRLGPAPGRRGLRRRAAAVLFGEPLSHDHAVRGRRVPYLERRAALSYATRR